MNTLQKVWAAEVNVDEIMPFGATPTGTGNLKRVVQNSYTPEGDIALSLIDMMTGEEGIAFFEPTSEVCVWRL